MIDINAADFIQTFKIEDATIGQIGYGFIGNSVVELFRPFVKNVLVYDKAKRQNDEGNVKHLSSVEEVLFRGAEVIFVAVPTPMKKNGECHTEIVESVLQDIQNTAAKIGRDFTSFIVVLKSTVPPGFTEKMQKRFAMRILFSPEFLTEANAVKDFKSTNRVLLGGEFEDAQVVFKYFEGVWPDRLAETYDGHPDGIVSIVHCKASEAEMVKLSTNVHLTSRVMVSNELYLICEKLGIDYTNVRMLTQLDRRIGLSHMNVPGPDGSLGYGGHCFVKDTQNLAFITRDLGLVEFGKGSIFDILHQRNLDIREDRDWEAQEGRAVIND